MSLFLTALLSGCLPVQAPSYKQTDESVAVFAAYAQIASGETDARALTATLRDAGLWESGHCKTLWDGDAYCKALTLDILGVDSFYPFDGIPASLRWTFEEVRLLLPETGSPKAALLYNRTGGRLWHVLVSAHPAEIAQITDERHLPDATLPDDSRSRSYFSADMTTIPHTERFEEMYGLLWPPADIHVSWEPEFERFFVYEYPPDPR